MDNTPSRSRITMDPNFDPSRLAWYEKGASMLSVVDALHLVTGQNSSLATTRYFFCLSFLTLGGVAGESGSAGLLVGRLSTNWAVRSNPSTRNCGVPTNSQP